MRKLSKSTRLTRAAIELLLKDGQKVGAYTAECSDAVLGANDPAQLEELNQIAIKKGYECK